MSEIYLFFKARHNMTWIDRTFLPAFDLTYRYWISDLRLRTSDLGTQTLRVSMGGEGVFAWIDVGEKGRGEGVCAAWRSAS